MRVELGGVRVEVGGYGVRCCMEYLHCRGAVPCLTIPSFSQLLEDFCSRSFSIPSRPTPYQMGVPYPI